MNNAKVTGLRGVELGVKDLHQSAAFYSCVWGLDPVVSEGDTIHLRANGTEHHIVTLRERPKSGLLGIHFATQDRVAVDARDLNYAEYFDEGDPHEAEIDDYHSHNTERLDVASVVDLLQGLPQFRALVAAT